MRRRVTVIGVYENGGTTQQTSVLETKRQETAFAKVVVDEMINEREPMQTIIINFNEVKP